MRWDFQEWWWSAVHNGCYIFSVILCISYSFSSSVQLYCCFISTAQWICHVFPVFYICWRVNVIKSQVLHDTCDLPRYENVWKNRHESIKTFQSLNPPIKVNVTFQSVSDLKLSRLFTWLQRREVNVAFATMDGDVMRGTHTFKPQCWRRCWFCLLFFVLFLLFLTY